MTWAPDRRHLIWPSCSAELVLIVHLVCVQCRAYLFIQYRVCAVQSLLVYVIQSLFDERRCHCANYWFCHYKQNSCRELSARARGKIEKSCSIWIFSQSQSDLANVFFLLQSSFSER